MSSVSLAGINVKSENTCAGQNLKYSLTPFKYAFTVQSNIKINMPNVIILEVKEFLQYLLLR